MQLRYNERYRCTVSNMKDNTARQSKDAVEYRMRNAEAP